MYVLPSAPGRPFFWRHIYSVPPASGEAPRGVRQGAQAEVQAAREPFCPKEVHVCRVDSLLRDLPNRSAPVRQGQVNYSTGPRIRKNQMLQ